MLSRSRLELEVDYDLEPEDIERHRQYVMRGMEPQPAWRQVAQDVLGNTGMIVQGAEAFDVPFLWDEGPGAAVSGGGDQ